MANGSCNRVIQSSYNASAGTPLMDQKKYEDAIAHLQEDQYNPLHDWAAGRGILPDTATENMLEAEAKLRGINVPTMEQALVVPAARSKRPNI